MATSQPGTAQREVPDQHTQADNTRSKAKPEALLGEPPTAATDGPANEFDSVLAMLKQILAVVSSMGELFTLELQLALGDARRLCGLFLLAIPLSIFAWLGFAVLVAWIAGDYSQSVAVGLLVFFLLQLVALLCIQQLWRRYSRSLTLPRTRRHLQSLLAITRLGEVDNHDSSASDP